MYSPTNVRLWKTIGYKLSIIMGGRRYEYIFPLLRSSSTTIAEAGSFMSASFCRFLVSNSGVTAVVQEGDDDQQIRANRCRVDMEFQRGGDFDMLLNEVFAVGLRTRTKQCRRTNAWQGFIKCTNICSAWGGRKAPCLGAKQERCLVRSVVTWMWGFFTPTSCSSV